MKTKREDVVQADIATPVRTLASARTGEKPVIVKNNATGRARARLDSLGLTEGTEVYVLSASYAGQILNVKGSRLAVCKAVARQLEVE